MSKFNNVFIATPTHWVKRYCARTFTYALLEHAPGARIAVICNSKADAVRFYEPLVPGHSYLHLRLDETHFNQPDSIHKRIVASMNLARSMFLAGKEECFL